MRRIIMFTLLCLTMIGGVASADRGGHRRDHRGGVYVQPRHQTQRYQTPRYVQSQRHVVTRPTYRYVRRPIYVQRPVIAYRYYNYAQRPALIVESYPSKAGYNWIPGHWDWNGYEWMWNPGHYEPDPAYTGYDNYNGSYSNDGYYNDGNYSNDGYYNQY